MVCVVLQIKEEIVNVVRQDREAVGDHGERVRPRSPEACRVINMLRNSSRKSWKFEKA